MTNAQVNYRQYLESVRHNRAQEDNWLSTLGETITHNRRQEELSRYATDTQANTSKYSADTSAAASRYVGEQRAGATMYSADQTANTAAQRLNLDQEKFKFEKLNQAYQNKLSMLKYNLDKMSTQSGVNLNSAKIDQISNDMIVALEQLEINAEQLGLNKLRAEAQNALDRARKWESYSKTAMNTQQILRTILNDITNIFDKRVGKAIDEVLPDNNQTTKIVLDLPEQPEGLDSNERLVYTTDKPAYKSQGTAKDAKKSNSSGGGSGRKKTSTTKGHR